MSPEFHQRVRDLFDQALERPAAHRLEFLREVCSGDTRVFAAVQSLLDAHDEAGSFLDGEAPAIQKVGRYLPQEEVGRGGMGVVYKALDSLIGRTIALKVIRLSSTGVAEADLLRKHLLGEARSAGSLSHPGIVVIFDVGHEADMAYIAMEFVEGPTLQQMLAAHPLLEHARLLEILRQSAAALDYAHLKGIVHRDVKPANIMLHRDGTVKIADFGIAKVTATLHQTQTGQLMGTPSYMAPEQMKGQSASGRSDQFSLAVVAFEMLAGAKPFIGDSLATLVLKVVYEPRPSLRALNPALPEAVDRVLQKAMAQDAADRYGSCGEFVAALEDGLKRVGDPVIPLEQPNRVAGAEPPAAPVLVSPPQFPSLSQESGGAQRQKRLAWGGAVLGLLLGVVVANETLIPKRKPPPANARVEEKAPPSPAEPRPAEKSLAVTRKEAPAEKQAPDPARKAPVSKPVPATATPALQPPKLGPPRVVEFRAEPSSLKRGERFVLSWSVVGASDISIGQGVGAVAPAGMRPLLADATTTFRLTAAGKGGTATAAATVTVSEPPQNPVPLPRRATMGSVAMESYLTRKVPPVYPAAARAAGIQGAVRFRATIGANGRVTHLQAASGPPELTRAASDAVMQYRYRPVLRNGQPVEVDTEIYVVFRQPGR
jgi:TonB family protein